MIPQLPLVQLYRLVQDYHSDFILVQNCTLTLTIELTIQVRYSSVYSQNLGLNILFFSQRSSELKHRPLEIDYARKTTCTRIRVCIKLVN